LCCDDVSDVFDLVKSELTEAYCAGVKEMRGLDDSSQAISATLVPHCCSVLLLAA
jgi:hypothetical protein